MEREWERYKGGKEWRITKTGVETREGYPRTKGDPISMYTLYTDYGADIDAAAERFDIPNYVIMAMISIEATRVKDDRSHFDARSLRIEPGYISDAKTPNKVSPGLMQTLISTAEWMNDKYDLYRQFNGDREPLTREDLFIPSRSIMAGTAYIRHLADKYSMEFPDIVLLVAAYNAGSIRYTDKNPWRLVTYGDGRIDKAIEFYNDSLAVLSGE